MTPPETSTERPQPDELQQEVNRLVDELFSGSEEGIFRKLCRLAHTSKADPEDFRRMLLRAGLRGSRASEIKAVLLCPKISQEFTRAVLPWKEALRRARGQIEDPTAVAAANLIHELFDSAPYWSSTNIEDGWSLQVNCRKQFRFTHNDGRALLVLRRTLPASPSRL